MTIPPPTPTLPVPECAWLESCSICPQSPSYLLPAIVVAGAIALKQGINQSIPCLMHMNNNTMRSKRARLTISWRNLFLVSGPHFSI